MRHRMARVGFLGLVSLVLLVVGPSRVAAQGGVVGPINGAIAYTDVIGTSPQERRAVFKYPGGQVTHPFGPVGRDSDRAPAWSPNGKRLAWVRAVWTTDTTSESTIMVADADGSNERTIGTAHYENGNPTLLDGKFPVFLTWSPDGTRVGLHDGLSVAADGPSNQWGTNIGGTMAMPGFDWSIDGILYRCLRNNLPPDLRNLFCVVQPSGVDQLTAYPKAFTDLPDGDVANLPRWIVATPTSRVAFIWGGPDPKVPTRFEPHIYTIQPSAGFQTQLGTDLRRFTGDTEYVSCTPGRGDSPRYVQRYSYNQIAPSPDGRFIAVHRAENKWDHDPLSHTCTIATVNNGIYVMRAGGAVQNTAAVGDGVREPAWQPSPANVKVIFRDKLRNELHGMKVELLTFPARAPTGIEPSNPSGGEYIFEDVPPGEYRVRAHLLDAEHSAFDVRYEYHATDGGPDGAVNADFQVIVPPGDQLIVKRLEYSNDESAFDVSNVNIYPLGPERLDDMATIFYELFRYVDWVKSSVTTDLGPLFSLHAFVDTIDGNPLAPEGAFYLYGTNRAFLGILLSAFEGREYLQYCPMNCEWHEYTHHLDEHNRGYQPLVPGDVNHAGYANSTTNDSLDEGIAMFLPAVFGGSPDYTGMADLEADYNAWSLGLGTDGNFISREDVSVAALLWDLFDDNDDPENTFAITPGSLRQHVPVQYDEDVSLDVRSLWDLLHVEQPHSVRDLQQIFDARNTTALIDLDHDDVPDVTRTDLLFLSHGFHPVLGDQMSSTSHRSLHYDIGRARLAGEPTNADVGLSHHAGYSFRGFTTPDRLYRENTPAPDRGYVGIEVRDTAGNPLKGAEVQLELHYDNHVLPIKRRIASGDGQLIRLNLPLYYEPVSDGDTLPPCDPADAENYVTVLVTAKLNGYTSTNTPSFDSCSYVPAMLASAPGTAAASFTLEFPQDSLPPVTTATFAGKDQVEGNTATKSWAVGLACDDPVDNAFASGCASSEYRINAGAMQPYEGPFALQGDGDYVIEYRSSDAASNQETLKQLVLRIGTLPPTISGFTPTSGPAGTSVTVTGTRFTGATAVTFNGTSAGFSVGSATSLTATVPTGATSGPISVTAPGGTATSTDSFTVLRPPVISGFTPAFGPVGSSVTITGSRFTGATRVAFNGTVAGFTVTSDTQLQASVPFGATTGPLSVQTAGGTGTSSTSFVVTNGLAPSITSFSPMGGVIGTSVTIKGTNLGNASTVTFNGVNASFRYKGSTIVASVPPGATTGPIRVTNAGGWADSATPFTVLLPPTIGGFTPTSGRGGTSVAITGSRFTGATAVKFGGTSAAFTVTSSTAITATVPRNAKSGPIGVTTPGGTATSSSAFTVVK